MNNMGHELTKLHSPNFYFIFIQYLRIHWDMDKTSPLQCSMLVISDEVIDMMDNCKLARQLFLL